MADQDGSVKKSGFSFGFSKKKETKTLKKSAVNDGTETKKAETDFVYSLEGSEVKSSKPKSTEAKTLVIPLIEVNNWRTPYLEKIEEKVKEKTKKGKTEESTDDLSRQAAKEILEATALQNQNWEERGLPDPNLAVPLLVRNKIPEGFETDDKLNVDLRPDGPEDANYEEIPIEQFGFAMLRGMGWKDGEGIGKNKELVAPLDAVARPKGMGLGADKSKMLQKKNGTMPNASSKNDEEESLTLKKSAYCLITKGKDKDLYGVVQGMDDDNARVVVKMALSGKSVTVSQYAVEVVSKKNYDKFSKYLNKSKVDKYKEEQEKKKRRSHSRERSRSPNSKDRKRHRNRSPDDRKQNGRNSPSRKYDSPKIGKDSERDKKRKYESKYSDEEHMSDGKSTDKKSKKSNSRADSDSNMFWVRPDIRVRIVDKKFKSGKYYKSKVVIEDVVSLDNCVCRTDEGKVVEGLSQSVLETVIPKSDNAHVLLVSGKYRGQIGELVKRNKEKCEALIQLLSDRDTVLRLSYDDICEYVGNIEHEFNY